MKSLTKAIKQEMDIDWDALDGKTVRIVSNGELAFETTYTLNYRGKGRKDLLSSWMERSSTTLLFEVLYEAWYAPNDDIEIIMDEGVPLLDSTDTDTDTDTETIDPYSIPTGSVVILESKRGVRHLAHKNPYWFVLFVKEVGEQFSAVSGSLFEDDFCSPSSSSPYKIISYITPEDLIKTLTAEPSEEETKVTDNTVHIVSPDSFEAMGQRINGLIAHSFGDFSGENLTTEPSGETTKVLKNTVKLSLTLDPDVIGKSINDSPIEAFSKLDWGKK